MFHRDQLALISLFGEPKYSDEFGRSEEYSLAERNLNLRVSFNLDSSDVSVEVQVEGRREPLFTATYLSSPGLRVVRLLGTSYLEIAAPGESLHDLPLSAGLRVRLAPITVELIAAN